MNKNSCKTYRICIIIIYWGNFPSWIDYFIKSCISNNSVKYLIFSDNSHFKYKADNISFFRLTATDFNKLASSKLGYNINISHPYKLCDFKPAYGLIFEDYLHDIDFWGYSDIDIIFGNIDSFFNDRILSSFDILSTYKGFLSGPFCIFRNNEYNKYLFSHVPEHKSILTSNNHAGFDEHIIRNSNVGMNLKKILWLFPYFYNSLGNIKSINELKYQFQWFYKRKTIKNIEPYDMTEAAYLANQKDNIKLYFNELMLSDIYFQRLNIKKWTLIWVNGRLKKANNENEIFAFHFKELKNKSLFIVKPVHNEVNQFYINETGIYS